MGGVGDPCLCPDPSSHSSKKAMCVLIYAPIVGVGFRSQWEGGGGKKEELINLIRSECFSPPFCSRFSTLFNRPREEGGGTIHHKRSYKNRRRGRDTLSHVQSSLRMPRGLKKSLSKNCVRRLPGSKMFGRLFLRVKHQTQRQLSQFASLGNYCRWNVVGVAQSCKSR